MPNLLETLDWVPVLTQRASAPSRVSGPDDFGCRHRDNFDAVPDSAISISVQNCSGMSKKTDRPSSYKENRGKYLSYVPYTRWYRLLSRSTVHSFIILCQTGTRSRTDPIQSSTIYSLV
jgi:hypothetical protein